ncbi:MAG TPA: EamA family transporter [Anaerolineales bacterium]|nr:EamA family transporter [Anaerolineales bacterium]
MAIAFGLTSAFAWGAADFTGGLASRQTGAYRTIFYAEVLGLSVIVVAAFVFWQPVPDLSIWLLAMAAGALGTSGLLLLYHSMTTGLMSIATPVSALLAALLPVILGSILEVPAGMLALIGFVFALAAVWLISQSEGGVKNIIVHISDLRLPLLAGVGFGLYFVLMHTATRNATLWPMMASRTGGVLILIVYMLLSRQPWIPSKGSLSMIALNGILDIGGNLFFVLAGQVGRLDVASVLSSLYPGSTLILASIFLHERLSRTQWIGIACAFVAIILLTVS